MSDSLRQLIASFTTQFDGSALAKGDKQIDGLVAKAETAAKAFAGAFVVKELWGFTDGLIEQGEELKTTAERIGLSAQALQEWRYAAGQVNVDQGELTAGLRVLQKNLFEAATVGGEAGKGFGRLGVAVKDSHGNIRELSSILPDLADKFAELKNPVERTAMAQQLFGRGGLALIPLLDRGAEGVAEMHKRFEELGGGLSTEMVKASEEAAIALKDLEFAGTGLKSRLAVSLLPFVTNTVEKFTEWTVAIQHLTADSQAFQATLEVLGFAGFAALSPLLGEMIAIAAPIAGAILLVDDLLVLFKGGKSLIGDFIDQMFGVGASKTFVQDLKVEWDALGTSIKFVGDELKHFHEFGEGVGQMFDDAADAINRAVGADHDSVSGHKSHRDHAGGAEGFGETIVQQNGYNGGALGALAGANHPAIAGSSAGEDPAQRSSDSLRGARESSPWATIDTLGAASMPSPTLESRAPASIVQNNEVNISIPTAVDVKAPEIASVVRRAVDESLTSHARDIANGY